MLDNGTMSNNGILGILNILNFWTVMRQKANNLRKPI